MHKDIREIIESTPRWQEMYPATITNQPKSIEQIIKDMKKSNPVKFEFIQHWVRSHHAGDAAEVEVAKIAIAELDAAQQEYKSLKKQAKTAES